VNIQALKSWQSELIAKAILPTEQQLQLSKILRTSVWVIHAMTEWSTTPIAQAD